MTLESTPETRKIHYFESSGEAYNETQCNEEIKNGDLLVIRSEKIVGIADTWPFAVTKAFGELHAPVDGVDIETDADFVRWSDSIRAAKNLMAELGFE